MNAYADYLSTDYITRDNRQFPTRNKAVAALRNAALAALDAAQDWSEISKQAWGTRLSLMRSTLLTKRMAVW